MRPTHARTHTGGVESAAAICYTPLREVTCVYLHRIRHDRDWWAHLLNVEAESGTGAAPYDERLSDYLWSVLGLGAGRRVLDLACGGGDVTRLLAKRGAAVVGLEISPRLVEHCAKTAVGLAGVRYAVGDMREPAAALAGEREFDAALVLAYPFGPFDPVGNAAVLSQAAALLRPGGRLLVQGLGLGGIDHLAGRTWSELAGGILLRHTWPDYPVHTRVTSYRHLDARGVLHTCEQEERIRGYGAVELTDLLHRAGFPAVTLSDGSFRFPSAPYDERLHPLFLALAKS